MVFIRKVSADNNIMFMTREISSFICLITRCDIDNKIKFSFRVITNVADFFVQARAD